MLSNAYLLAKFRFDTAENEPAKKLQTFDTFFCKFLQISTAQVNTEEPTREIDFDEFIRICVSQRPENDMSVMDMNEIRKTARLGLRRLEKRSSLLLKAVQQLPRKEQLEQACI